MRSWAKWYRILLLCWLVIGLPGLVVGYGFSSGDLEAPIDPLGLVLWLLCVVFLISPIVLWPMRRQGFR